MIVNKPVSFFKPDTVKRKDDKLSAPMPLSGLKFKIPPTNILNFRPDDGIGAECLTSLLFTVSG